MKNALIVIDRIELKYYEFNELVTNFWFNKILLEMGLEVDICTIDGLSVSEFQPYANCYKTKWENNDLVKSEQPMMKNINDFDLVLFRPDPPVDIDYINATLIFDFVDENKVKIINSPKAIRNFNEKFHSNLFPDFVPENIVSADKNQILNFVKTHKKAVIKPLNQCFGQGVTALFEDDINLNSLIKTATNNYKTICLVQKYLDGARYGDKRVLTLGDEVLGYAVTKAPLDNDFKFSEHSDNYLRIAELTEHEKHIAKTVAEKLNKMGIPLIGLDILDGKILEINVTSPCYFLKEIKNLYGVDLSEKFKTFFDEILCCTKI
ncbi:hypothetical protein IJS77_00660 [bacterium]|nr:hypothetical protein [bacterium]